MSDNTASPCIGVCELDHRLGICLGCLRTGDEIAGWSRFDPEQRRRVLARRRPAAGSNPEGRE
jgi:predicted Fe-S protein YdhL (DUF1289 family)